MSNQFTKASASAIARHGAPIIYTEVPEAVYDVNTSSVVNTSQVHNLRAYMKHIKANEFSYPSLIGRDVGMFYILATNLGFVPEVNDTITFNSKTYKVDSVQSHSALQEIVLYRILAVV
jgi:hypothetical protein